MKIELKQENHLLPRKKRRQLERKLVKAKRNAWQHREKDAKEQRRKNLLEDNQAEDMHIKKLEKLLGIKSDRKTYLRGFVDDGLDFLLDFCDRDQRKQILLAEGDGEGNAWYDENDEDQQWLAKKQKERVKLANKTEDIKQDKTKKKKNICS
ncbi:unnamed protein product [Adineta steineri]|uniref:Uncharacterized protein n=1 Tax=Adineta steineri TaxID=433720 RepID=A0A814VAH9_9BILA|nr:unnamed protein product [Adineta steineri]CAF1497788.1 unnamed protein product [Adineta steineri]